MQSLLTFGIEASFIVGLSGIILHAFYTSHKKWMATYCPPVAPYNPTQEKVEEIQKPEETKLTPEPEEILETPRKELKENFSKFSRKELIERCQSDKERFKGYTTSLKKGGAEGLRAWMETK